MSQLLYMALTTLVGLVTVFVVTGWIRARRHRREAEDILRLWFDTEPMGDVSQMTTGRIDASVITVAPLPDDEWVEVEYEIVDDPEDIRIHRFDRLLGPVIPQPFDQDTIAQMQADMGGAIDEVTGGTPLM